MKGWTTLPSSTVPFNYLEATCLQTNKTSCAVKQHAVSDELYTLAHGSFP